MKAQKTILAFVFALALLSVGRADVTFPADAPTSWDGNLANPANWPGSTIPSSGNLIFSGFTGNLTLSDNLTLGTSFRVKGQSSVSAAFGNYALEVANGIVIGADGNAGNTLNLTSGSMNGLAGVTVGSAGSSNTLRVSNPGTSLSCTNDIYVGYSGSGNVLIVTNGANLTKSAVRGNFSVGAGTSPSGNLALLDGAGTINVSRDVYVGNKGSNNRMVVRNVDTANFSGNIYVGNEAGTCGNSLLITNVSHLTSGPIYIGYNGSAFCTGEVYLASSDSSAWPTFTVGNAASSTNCYLLVDGGGNSRTVSGGPFSNFTLKRTANTVELRNMTMTYGSGQTIDAASCTNAQYVIGKGATVISTATGSSVAFQNCAPGFGLMIDGGCAVFSNKSVNISGDAFRMNVLSGGEVAFSNFTCNARNVDITISNATVRASGTVNMPDNTLDGWATNIVLRFVGTSPRLTSGIFYQLTKGNAGIASDDNKTGVVFDFVLPENGYEAVPFETEKTIYMLGKYCKIRVDASAYRGDRRWMPLMRSNNNTIEIKLPEAELCADFPNSPELTVRHRIVAVDGAKELQIQVRRPEGLIMVYR